MNSIVGTHDILFVVLDTLRYDVAVSELEAGRTPVLASLVRRWEKRHSPASFTFPAHQAFFAGFLPTPAAPTREAWRLFACRFAGSETTGSRTKVFNADNWIEGLAGEGYATMGVGGVGFFNGQTPLSRVLPSFFQQSEWRSEFGVTEVESPKHQFHFAAGWLDSVAQEKPVLLFINVSAIHQPNHHHLRQDGPDDIASHAAALRDIDAAFPTLLDAFKRRKRPTFFIVTSDHGTAYGEDGWRGHRLAHEVVWTVPYAEGVIS